MARRRNSVFQGGLDDTVPSGRVRPGGYASENGTQVGLHAFPTCAWVLGGLAVVLSLAVCGLWALYLAPGQMLRGDRPSPTPIIWTPTPAPTPTVGPTAQATEAAGPTPTISPEIAIGRYVRVAGTGGYGLSLRSGPGENYTRMDVALEGKIFIVVDGPTVSGGSEWWRIRDHENEEREWWAVGNFLEPVEHP
jgi:hypothetical protein